MIKDIENLSLIDSPNSFTKPVLVRASKVGSIVFGWNPKTAANWRSLKIGPSYYTDDLGSIFYKVDEILEYFTRHPVKTSGGINK
jgi:hypothetical protein